MTGAALVVAGLATVVGAGEDAVSAGAPTGPARLDASPIQHVVIFYQENHTFDDVLGAYCAGRPTPCDGYTGSVKFKDGITAPNIVQPDKIPIVDHSPKSQHLGLTNQWDRVKGCRDAPYNCVSHVDPGNIPNLANYADAYTVSDATFAAGQAASFVAHVSLGAGTFDRFLGGNPDSKVWGCGFEGDAPWGRKKDPKMEPSCIPNLQGQGPYRSSPVPYVPTIMERMEQKGLTWHMYEGQTEQSQPDRSNFSVCPLFYWCFGSRFNLNYNSSDVDFLEAAQAGTLPNLSIMVPDFGVSQHNGTSMAKGDNYLGDLISAVMEGPDWDSTAIFVTYDDCGCFYDHVKPPSKKMGMRNPMVIISPYAKPGATDSMPAIQPYSVLAFTQHVFGLAPITDDVTNAYDYANSFDFTQEPLPGVPNVHTKVPKGELRAIARLRPSIIDDPT